MILSALGFTDAELSISFVADSEIAVLAGSYGRAPQPTDVLAFAQQEAPQPDGTSNLLGDVIISLETAARQAARRRTSLEVELRDLLIHGVLHLLGMDHERDADARNMRALERHLRWTLDQ